MRMDRPSGGYDRGGDKPPRPRPGSDPPRGYTQGNPERGNAEQGNRNAAEGVNGQGDSRGLKDKPAEEREERGREGTVAAAGVGSDTEKNTDVAKRYQALFDQQGGIINVQRERIRDLKDDNADLQKWSEKLEARNDKLEARLEQRDQTIDRQAKEIDRLKAENSGLREKTEVGQGQTAVDKYAAGRTDKPVDTSDRPWYRKFPSEKLIGIGTTAAGLGQAIAAGMHHMSSAESGIITASIGVGVSILGYAREKHTERKNKDADRPEN